MSFILDALKKSEAERLRRDAPGIASIPERTRQKPSSKWIWLVLALVTLNLVVLATLMIKVEQESTPAEVPAAVTNTEPLAAPVVTPSAIASTNEQDALPVAGGESETVIDEPLAATAPLVNPPATTEIMIEPRSGIVNSDLETFNNLRAKGAFVLPDMHLDIHVYSGNAADRFVFVNMSKYTENSRLTEGPIVQEITPDGVILNYQGTAFLLPRE